MNMPKGEPLEILGDGRDETPNLRADRNWNEILQELRVAQTGTQILAGFLLAVAFQSRFTELDSYQLGLYLVLVALACVATAIGLAPVSLHRIYFGRGQKENIVRVGSRLLIADLVAVAALASGVTSLIFDLTLGRVAGFLAFVGGAVVVVGLWVIMPRASSGAPSLKRETG
jgi:hypothetical protein